MTDDRCAALPAHASGAPRTVLMIFGAADPMSAPRVVIAPLVLLSVVDHYKRLSSSRVVGILLGSATDTLVDITNSFAIPFEECEDGFYIDTSYLQNMYDLYRKVNNQEKILGWYHSGPRMQASDPEITRALLGYCARPVLAIINVHGGTHGLPCQAFQLVGGSDLRHLPVQVGADETEEVGVEHLLRDIRESTGCGIRDRVHNIEVALEAYRDVLDSVLSYLKAVQDGRAPNRRIMDLLQEVLNEVPVCDKPVRMETLYAAELCNAVVATHDMKLNNSAVQVTDLSE